MEAMDCQRFLQSFAQTSGSAGDSDPLVQRFLGSTVILQCISCVTENGEFYRDFGSSPAQPLQPAVFLLQLSQSLRVMTCVPPYLLFQAYAGVAYA